MPGLGREGCGLCGEEVRGRAPVDQGGGEDGVVGRRRRLAAGKIGSRAMPRFKSIVRRSETHGMARIGTKRLGDAQAGGAVEVASAGMTGGSDGPLLAREDNVFLAGPGLECDGPCPVGWEDRATFGMYDFI